MIKNNLFFKHYINALTSESLLSLKDKFGWKGYGRYWAFLELLYQHRDGEAQVVSIRSKEIFLTLGFRSFAEQSSFLGSMVGLRLINSCQPQDNWLTIDAPILLELQARNFKKAKSQREKVSLKKERSKEVKKERTKKETKVSKKVDLKFDKKSHFDEFYAVYPKKSGEKHAKTVFNRTVKCQNTYEVLLQSLENYCEYVCLQKQILKYTRGPTSFIENYKDYISVDWIEQALEPLRARNSDIYKDSFDFIDVSESPRLDYDNNEQSLMFSDIEKRPENSPSKTIELRIVKIKEYVSKIVDNWKKGYVPEDNTRGKTNNQYMTAAERRAANNKRSFNEVTEIMKRGRM